MRPPVPAAPTTPPAPPRPKPTDASVVGGATCIHSEIAADGQHSQGQRHTSRGHERLRLNLLRDVAVSARLGLDPFRDDAEHRLVATIQKSGGEFRGAVAVFDKAGTRLGSRDFSSTDCLELSSRWSSR